MAVWGWSSRGAAGWRMICVLTGPECCGKTTLAEALSKQLRWPVLPEIARAYLTQRAIDTAQGAYRYRPSDLIALVQAQGPRDRTRTSDHRIADTDLLTPTIWWQEKYGPVPALFNEAWLSQAPRFYLLCRPDLPWELDSLRENPQDRERLLDSMSSNCSGAAANMRFVMALEAPGKNALAAIKRKLDI